MNDRIASGFMTEDGGPESRRGALARICQAFGVAILYVFGSQAREVLAWLEGGRQTLFRRPILFGLPKLDEIL